MTKKTVQKESGSQKQRPGFSKAALALDEEQFNKDKDLIERRIRLSYPDAAAFDYELGIRNTTIGNTYYIEFASKRLDDEDAYYFCLVDRERVEVFDSEIELLNYAMSMLERRRSVFQRISEFTVIDVLAFIVVVVLSAALLNEGYKGEYSKEIIGLFGIVVGYLFGRKV